MGTRLTYEPLQLPQPLIDFIYRRSGLDILAEHSLKNVAANAYLRGMNDAVTVIRWTK